MSAEDRDLGLEVLTGGTASKLTRVSIGMAGPWRRLERRKGDGDLGGQDALMMWNKGNGGRASRDGAQWFLRLVEPATTGLASVVEGCGPNMTAEMGLSPQRYVDTEAETNAGGWRRRARWCWRFEPGGRRETQAKGGGVGKSGGCWCGGEVRRREA